MYYQNNLVLRSLFETPQDLLAEISLLLVRRKLRHSQQDLAEIRGKRRRRKTGAKEFDRVVCVDG